MRPLQLVDVLEYLCLGIHIDRSHDGRVSGISEYSWLTTGFWLGWRMPAISQVFARQMIRLRQAYFASRREAVAVISVQYVLGPPQRTWADVGCPLLEPLQRDGKRRALP